MRASEIRVGDRLILKRDNSYGLGPLTLTVADLRYRTGYKTPWVIVEQANVSGAFRPSDFKRKEA